MALGQTSKDQHRVAQICFLDVGLQGLRNQGQETKP